jgi:hypothetical protein
MPSDSAFLVGHGWRSVHQAVSDSCMCAIRSETRRQAGTSTGRGADTVERVQKFSARLGKLPERLFLGLELRLRRSFAALAVLEHVVGVGPMRIEHRPVPQSQNVEFHSGHVQESARTVLSSSKLTQESQSVTRLVRLYRLFQYC